MYKYMIGERVISFHTDFPKLHGYIDDYADDPGFYFVQFDNGEFELLGESDLEPEMK